VQALELLHHLRRGAVEWGGVDNAVVCHRAAKMLRFSSYRQGFKKILPTTSLTNASDRSYVDLLVRCTRLSLEFAVHVLHDGVYSLDPLKKGID
jgi:hypothetical protein